jgi:hypothetical protein
LAACSLDRRSLFAAATLVSAGLASTDQASSQVAPALKRVLGYARGSFTARPFSLLDSGKDHDPPATHEQSPPRPIQKPLLSKNLIAFPY